MNNANNDYDADLERLAERDFCTLLGHEMCHTSREAAAGLCTCGCHAEKTAQGQPAGPVARASWDRPRVLYSRLPPMPHGQTDKNAPIEEDAHHLLMQEAMQEVMRLWQQRMAEWRDLWENSGLSAVLTPPFPPRFYEIDLRRRSDWFRRSAQEQQSRQGAIVRWRYPHPSHDPAALGDLRVGRGRGRRRRK